MSKRVRWRQVGNLVNLSTPLGLALARCGGATVRRGPEGIVLAEGYRWRFPTGMAFTVGDVTLTRGRFAAGHSLSPTAAPYVLGDRVLRHEIRHTWQWLACGPFFLPAYGAAMAWSMLRSGDRAAANVFERWAGLADGGYTDSPRRSLRAGLGATRVTALGHARRLPRIGRRLTGR